VLALMSQSIQTIEHDGYVLAIILPAKFEADGIHFFTPDDFSQQLAYMRRPSGYVVQPHVHNPVKREVEYTKEVLFIRSGTLRMDLYDDQQNYLQSRMLSAGDVVLLVRGGHGFEMMEDCEIIEVKQGPYAGDKDKTRFTMIGPDQLNVKD
jgi:mannose-6-phosphate isomerase-like protein (cupin superfamily)